MTRHPRSAASSRSRAEIGYCLRAGHKRRWLDHDLPLALFEKALRDIDAVAEVRFHGWGDPLANPDILAMLAAIPLLGESLDFVSLGFGLAIIATVAIGRTMKINTPATS